ncbi:MAG: type I-U CRISPR-associated protein Csb2 [Opitutales bacterium]
MLTLGIEYLTGYAVATSTGDRAMAEWPPHPGRVFMAMASAYFESRPEPSETETLKWWNEEAAALRWLETLDAPGIFGSEEFDPRDVLDVYVPPNDMGPTKRTVIPTYRTNRQPRTFPKVRPRQSTLFIHWTDAEPTDPHRAALERICAKVIRIGHSSSLVRMWVSAEPPQEQTGWAPASEESATRSLEHLRMPGPGCLDHLREQYNGEAVERFYDFYTRIQNSKGKAQKEAKAEFEAEFGVSWKASLTPPVSHRPVLSMTQAYQRVSNKPDEATPVSTVFDDTLLVLDKREGPSLGLESTWQLLTALRGAIEKHAAPTPEWVSGHQADGTPSENPHLALLPLAFVGNQHADGHLLGVALAFPKAVSRQERGKLVGKLLYDAKGLPQDLKLTLGKLGVWTLGEELRPSPPKALRSATWTGPADVWASVSPVVLDRHPKTDPRKDRSGYLAEVATIITESCRRIGLPDPVEIDIDKTSWHRGAPRAKPGPDGYPLMPARPGGPNRRQVHVWLRFDQPVLGPVLLGAGRYRGYGLCKPWRKGENETQ